MGRKPKSPSPRGWIPTVEEQSVLIAAHRDGLLRAEVARRLGKSHSQISRWYEKRGLLRRPRWKEGELESIADVAPVIAGPKLKRSPRAVSVRRCYLRGQPGTEKTFRRPGWLPTSDDEAKMVAWHDEGLSRPEVAKRLGRETWEVARWYAEHDLRRPRTGGKRKKEGDDGK